MIVDIWAKRWNVSTEALQELRGFLGIDNPLPLTHAGKSETAVLNLVKAEASRKGLRLWRNNVGAAYMKEGTFLRYGLANESKAMNEVIKSADLIGIRPVVITMDLVGLTIGQFVSREIKHAGWKFTGTPLELAQQSWAQLIVSLGGDACFTVGEGTL